MFSRELYCQTLGLRLPTLSYKLDFDKQASTALRMHKYQPSPRGESGNLA